MEPPAQSILRAGSAGPRVVAGSSSAVQQARLMESEGTAWHAVKCGNLEMITKLFPNKSNVYAKGPVGENVLHVAMLLNTPSTLAITRFLVKMFGAQLVNTPIQERRSIHDPPGTYEGQTALHIAIVNRDMDMVKFLVQHGANVRPRAWGTFFRHDGPTYYGEFPLSFAVCTGQRDMVAYLIRHGAQPNTDRDSHGNTALHMAVIHEQPDMYDFLVDMCGASVHVANHAGLTPLVLGAHMGKFQMFKHITSRRRRPFYSFGRVTSYSLPLREIDTVQGDDGPDGGYVPNALEVVVRKTHLDMLEEPLLHTLLSHKWQAFARAQFLLHFAGYLLLEVSQTLLIWMHSDPLEWNQPARASQEFVGVFLALLMLGVEVVDYINWARECYHRRLTMVVPQEQDPPLYPIPGEMRDARDNRQGLFARLSARMGFSAGGSHGSYSGVHHSSSSKADSKTDTHAAAAAAAATAAAGNGGLRHPHHKQQQQQLSRLAPAQPPFQGAALSFADGVGDAHLSAPQQQQQVMVQVPVQRVSPPQQQQQQQRPTRSSPFKSAPSSPPHSPRPNSPVGVAGGAASALTPGRSGCLRSGVTDTPINLESYITGGVVLGAGKSSQGVGLVDSGLTATAAAAAGGGKPDASGDISSSSSMLGSSPVTGASLVTPMAAAAGGGQSPYLRASAASSAAAEATAAEAAAGGSFSELLQQQALHREHVKDGVPLGEGVQSAATDSSSSTCQQQQQQPVRPAGPLGEGREDMPAGAAAAAAARAGAASEQQEQQQRLAQRRSSDATDGSQRRGADDDDDMDVVSVGLPIRRVRSYHSTTNMAVELAQSPLDAQQGVLDDIVGSPAGSLHPLSPTGDRTAAAAAAGRESSSGSAADPAAQQHHHHHRVSFYDEVSVEGGSSSPRLAVDMQQQQQHGVGSAAAGGFDSVTNSLRTTMDGQSSDGAAAPSAAAGAGAAGSIYSSGRRAVSFSVSSGPVSHMGAPLAGPGSGRFQAADTGVSGVSPADMLERQRTRARSGGGDLAPGLLKRAQLSRKVTGGADLASPQSHIDATSSFSPTAFQEASTAAPAAGATTAAGGGGLGGSGGGGVPAGWASGRHNSGEINPTSLDVERLGSGGLLDPHKTRLRAFFETSYEGVMRMMEDPWLFVWHLHLLLTMMHFLTWISSYGWVGGPGPASITVRQFDDVIVSMMGLTGWLAVIYFFRGFQPTGRLAYILERCLVDVLKFVSLFVLWDLGFTLAFYTMQNGVLGVAPNGIERDTPNLTDIRIDPFESIGYTMVTLINLGAGLSHWEYAMTCRTNYPLTTVFCTIYYLLYIATVVLLLMNLLTAMIITTVRANQSTATAHWKHRWAIYVLKAERRLPSAWAQRLRLGTPQPDPKTGGQVYSHIFEAVDEDSPTDTAAAANTTGSTSSSKSSMDSHIRALEVALEELRKKKGT